MAISDYAELVLEAARRTGISDLTSRADMIVSMAEDQLSKVLRIAGQEASTTLTTDASGEVALPSDFQEMRSARVGSYPLRRLSLDQVLNTSTKGWCVRGSTLVSTEASTDHVIVYYASIPSLDTNDTNHLLTSEPELYLHAVMFQAYSSVQDFERAGAVLAYLEGLTMAANARAYMSRNAGNKVHLGNVA